MIHQASIQEVRDRADIVEVVGHFISLKKRGANYIANCPFHNEKTPSFNVNPSRGIFKCFGCGKAGDVVTFVQEFEKFSFVEAIRWLADYYKIELQETQENDPTATIERHRGESLRILFEFAVSYFEKILREDDEGQAVGMSYLAQRGFSPHTIAKFRLGYALESWDAFYQHALKNGFTEELLLHSGLVTQKGDRIYDTYRGRVIFPIMATMGKPVGLGARILQTNTKAPKYINSPESEIYQKSKILYGLYQSRNAITKFDEVYLAEGYTDVISLHQAGVENVVASSGTSLTEGQLKLLKNLTRNITIVYDGDEAGIKAAIRGMQMALSEGFNIQIVQFPQGEDPDSFVHKNGAEAFRTYVAENKKDVIDFQIDLGLARGNLNPQELSHLANDLAETISKIHKAEDFVLRQEFVRKASQRLNIPEQGLMQLINKNLTDFLRKEQKKEIDQLPTDSASSTIDLPPLVDANTPTQNPTTQGNKSEWRVLQDILRYGQKPYNDQFTVCQYFFETYELETVENPLCKLILLEYWDAVQKGENDDQILLKFIRHQNSEVKNKVIELLYDEEQPNEKWRTKVGIPVPTPEENYLEECRSAFAYFELNVLSKLLEQVLQEIQDPNVPLEEKMELLGVQQELKQKEKQLLSVVVRT